jgi:hypothetical protein
MELQKLKRVKQIRAEKRKLHAYLIRSQKALLKNQQLLKVLEKEEEMILSPILPGIFS